MTKVKGLGIKMKIKEGLRDLLSNHKQKVTNHQWIIKPHHELLRVVVFFEVFILDHFFLLFILMMLMQASKIYTFADDIKLSNRIIRVQDILEFKNNIDKIIHWSV